MNKVSILDVIDEIESGDVNLLFILITDYSNPNMQVLDEKLMSNKKAIVYITNEETENIIKKTKNTHIILDSVFEKYGIEKTINKIYEHNKHIKRLRLLNFTSKISHIATKNTDLYNISIVFPRIKNYPHSDEDIEMSDFLINARLRTQSANKMTIDTFLEQFLFSWQYYKKIVDEKETEDYNFLNRKKNYLKNVETQFYDMYNDIKTVNKIDMLKIYYLSRFLQCVTSGLDFKNYKNVPHKLKYLISTNRVLPIIDPPQNNSNTRLYSLLNEIHILPFYFFSPDGTIRTDQEIKNIPKNHTLYNYYELSNFYYWVHNDKNNTPEDIVLLLYITDTFLYTDPNFYYNKKEMTDHTIKSVIDFLKKSDEILINIDDDNYDIFLKIATKNRKKMSNQFIWFIKKILDNDLKDTTKTIIKYILDNKKNTYIKSHEKETNILFGVIYYFLHILENYFKYIPIDFINDNLKNLTTN